MDIYGDVLLELVTALGAALFLANAYALFRRRRDRQEAAKEAVVRSRPGSPVRKAVQQSRGKLGEAPVGRSVMFGLVGLVVFIWGMATITS
ncbi:MAG: hypothetical protein WEC34_08845 [Acidimicrobiia bacterium]|jgi:hypothetical protein